MTLNPIQQQVNRHRKLFRKNKLRRFLACLIIGFIGFYIGFYCFEYFSSLSSIVRWVFPIVFLLYASLVTVWLWWLPTKRYSTQDALLQLEQECYDKQQLIRTAYELETDPSKDEGILRQKVLTQANELILKHKNRKEALESRLPEIVVSLIIAFLIFLLVNSGHRVAFWRFINPTSQLSYTQIYLESQSVFHTNENVMVKLRVKGRNSTDVKLFHREKGKDWQTHKITHESRRRYKIEFKKCTQSFQIYATAGDGRTKIHNLDMDTPPEIDSLIAILHHPDYMHKKPSKQTGGAIVATEGDSIALTVIINQRMQEGFLELSDGQKFRMHVNGYKLTAGFSVLDTCKGKYTIHGRDKQKRELKKQAFQLIVNADKLPTIKIVDPAKDLEVTASTEVPIKLFANDDYGLKEVGLTARIDQQEVELAGFYMKDSIVLQQKNIARLCLEKYPVSVSSNIRVYAWAIDNKPGRTKRAVSILRGIDIRPYRLTYKLDKQTANMPAGQSQTPSLLKIEELIQIQRQINSGLFKCAEQGAKPQELVKWKKHGNQVKKQVHALNNKLGSDALKNTENEQQDMLAALTERNYTAAFNHGDQAVAHMMKLRNDMSINLSKKKSGSCCKNSCNTLTELGLDVDKLITQEKEVQQLYIDQFKTGNATIGFKAIEAQRLTGIDARELQARLEIHPDGTELNLERMSEICELMDKCNQLLSNRNEANKTIQLTIDQLIELGNMLRGSAPSNPQETLQKAKVLAHQTAQLLEKQAKKKETIGRKDSNKKSMDQKGKKPSKKAKPKKGNKPGDKSGQKPGTQAGGNSDLNKASRNASTISDWLNNMNRSGVSEDLNQRLKQLNTQLQLEQLAEELQKDQNNSITLESMAKQFRALEKELEREHLNLAMSKLDRLNSIHTKVQKLQSNNQEEASKSILFADLIKDLDIANHKQLKSFAHSLKISKTSARSGELQKLDALLSSLINELLANEIPSGKDIKVPDRYASLVEKYFKALSDDMDLDDE